MDMQRNPVSNPGAFNSTATAAAFGHDRIIETDIPSRLDSLRWSGFHTRVVLALGITWILDGLEVTLAGALSGALKESPALHFQQFRDRLFQQRLSGRRRARRNWVRLAHRPDRAQGAFLHHARRCI